MGLMAIPRYGESEEIAAMVAYLAGPEAGLRHRREPDHRRRLCRMKAQIVITKDGPYLVKGGLPSANS